MDYTKYSNAPASQQDKWNRQLALWLAVHLAAVPPYARAQVSSMAKQIAGSAEVDAPDVWKAIPSNADLALAAGLVTGMGAITGAAMGRPVEEMRPLIEDAEAIAAGTVLHGDPSQNAALPSLAAVVMDSAMRSGEPDLLDPAVASALYSIAQSYDCASHTLPLGGGVLDSIKSWWKGLTGTPEERAAYQEQKAAKAQQKAVAQQQDAQTARMQALMSAGFGFDEASRLAGTGAEPTPEAQPSAELEKAAAGDVSSPEAAIAKFKESLEKSATSVEQAKENAEVASAQLARLRWAEAPLKASKEAADLLRDVNPDFSSPSAAMQTAFDILLAAKESGNVPRIRLMTRLLSAMRKKDSGFGEWLSGILSGDPDAFTNMLAQAEADGQYAESLDELLREKGALQSFDSLARLDPSAWKEVSEL